MRGVINRAVLYANAVSQYTDIYIGQCAIGTPAQRYQLQLLTAARIGCPLAAKREVGGAQNVAH